MGPEVPGISAKQLVCMYNVRMCACTHTHTFICILLGGRVHIFHQILKGVHETKDHGTECRLFTGVPAKEVPQLKCQGKSRC